MIKRILFSALLLVATPAMAVIDTWSFANDSKTLTNGFGNVFTVDNNSGNSNAALDKVSITGWSDTGNNNQIEAGKLSYATDWGLMLEEDTGGTFQHSIDNYGGNFDMVLVSFDQSMALTEIGIDWRLEGHDSNYYYNNGIGSYQADISVAAYTGSDPITTLVGTSSWGSLASGNWTTVGTYGDVGRGSTSITYQSINTSVTPVESKYWLIGAYNPVFTGGERSGVIGTAATDAFKLASVAGTYADTPPPGGQIPEPASLFLFATALFGLMSTKRSKAKA